MKIHQRNHRHKPDWSNLPTEILQLIDQFLFQGKDLLNFRSVCKNWFHSTLVSSFLPRTTISDIPKKVISSSILLLRPLNSPHLPPFMTLAVEPIKGVIKLFNPFTRTPLLNLPENLDLACFSSTQLATAYHVVDDDYELDMFSPTCCRFIKVLICFRWTIPSFRHCDMLTLSDGGRLHKFRPFKKYKPDTHVTWWDPGDDIVRYIGWAYSLDEEGGLWCFKDIFSVGLYIVDCSFCGKVRRRKRLAVIKSSSSTERLLMIVPVDGEGCNLHFKVYELLDKETEYVWSEVTTFGDADKVLFVSRYYSFFAPAGEYPGCQLSNCIVFSDDAFPRYSESKYKSGWSYEGKVGNALAVYSMVGQDFYSMTAESYPDFPVILLQSPPPWILPNASSRLQSQFQRSDEGYGPILSYPGFPVNLWSPPQWISQDHTPVSVPSHRKPMESDEMLPATSNQEGAPLQKHIQKSSAPLSGPKSRKGTTEIASTSAAQERATGNPSNSEEREETTRILSTTEDVKHVIEPASHLDTSRVECSNTQITHSVSRAYITSITQSNQSDNSAIKFEGLEIRSTLVPMLQKIWSKHGNLIENITIRNGDIVSRALESLATAVLILEEIPVRTLTDSQVDYLSSALSDLRGMQFKVDWLVPCVEKALELHKSKPLIDSLDKVVHCKAQVAQKKSKLLEEVAALDKLADELEEEIVSVSKVVPFYGNVDLDKPLGGGLS